MKKALKGIRSVAAAAGIAVLVQGLGALALGPSADAVNGTVAATTRVHVRSGPSTSSSSLTILNPGDKLESLGSSNGWTKVNYKGRTAYVYSSYLKGASEQAQQPVSSGSSGSAYSTTFLNLRVGPSLNNKVSLIISKGTKVTLTGKVSGQFAQVVYAGKTLWAASQYLSGSSSAGTNLPKVTGQARGTTALMIRTTSTTKFTNLGDAPKGTVFDLTGVKQNGMAQVIYKGAVRWVNASYLTPISSSTSPTKPSTPKTTVRYATTVLNIWSGSSGNSYNGELARGATLNVTGVVTNGRAQIVHNGAIKWVTSRYVSSTKPSTNNNSSSGNGTSLNRGYSSGLDETNANTKMVIRDVWSRYPQIKTMYGVRRDALPDHPSGRAVDVMLPNYKSNNALGWQIANYYRANASKFNIDYIIFDQKIWSVARNSQGWRPMASRGSDTANHIDHVHINTYRA